MNQTQEQIEHLRTIQETSSFWADVAENQLPALADKIDNIKLPEIDLSNVESKLDNINNAVSDVGKISQELSFGKESIVNAINHQGGNASINDSLSLLADKIKLLHIFETRLEFYDDIQTPIDPINLYASKYENVKIIYSNTPYAIPLGLFSNSDPIEIHLPNTTGISANSSYPVCKGSSLTKVYLDSAITLYGYSFSNKTNLIVLNAPKVKNNAGYAVFNICSSLIDITIGGAFSSDINFNNMNYNPVYAYDKYSDSLCFEDDMENYGISFKTNWDKWKWCIINHFALNLEDRSADDKLKFTITFGSTILNQFDQEMIDAFTNRGWNLA